MLHYEDVENKPRELLAATGLTRDEFEALLDAFENAYDEAYPADRTLAGQWRQRQRGGGCKGNLGRLEDKLLFILIYGKTYPLQTMLGLQFGMSQGRVNEWIHRLTPILHAALGQMGHLPVRDGASVAASPLAAEGGPDLVIDGTERRRQRPQDEATQREKYSGKKRPTRTRISSLST